MSGEKLSLFTSIAVNKQPKTDKQTELVRLITNQVSKSGIGNFSQLVQDLDAAGIVIGKDRIAIKAKQTDIVDNNGNTIAMFSNGKLNASLIDADTITVNHLYAKSAQGGTSVGHFGNYDIDAAKISGVGYPLWLGATTAANAPFRVSKDGELYATKGIFKGEIQGVSGSFYTLTCINKNGASSGEITFSSDTGMEFSGDIRHQGVHSENRGYRFYSADIWCRGAFGHCDRVVAVVKGGYMLVYTMGQNHENYVYVTLPTTINTSGTTVYKIPLYSPGDYSTNGLAGCSIDVVVFNVATSGYVYDFDFSGTNNTKTLDIVNVNDNQNANYVKFFDTVGAHSLDGGKAMHLIYVKPKWLTPTLEESRFGKGIFWTGEKDLNWA